MTNFNNFLIISFFSLKVLSVKLSLTKKKNFFYLFTKHNLRKFSARFSEISPHAAQFKDNLNLKKYCKNRGSYKLFN